MGAPLADERLLTPDRAGTVGPSRRGAVVPVGAHLHPRRVARPASNAQRPQNIAPRSAQHAAQTHPCRDRRERWHAHHRPPPRCCSPPDTRAAETLLGLCGVCSGKSVGAIPEAGVDPLLRQALPLAFLVGPPSRRSHQGSTTSCSLPSRLGGTSGTARSSQALLRCTELSHRPGVLGQGRARWCGSRQLPT